jgi:hypothetical protein
LRPFLSIVLSVVLFCYGVALADPVAPRFEIYRVELVERPGAPALERQIDNPKYRHAYVTQEYAAATAVQQESPILTDLDVVEFCWATQHVHLTREGAQRWDSLGGFNVALAGLPIQVCVDGEPQYAAFVWNPLSSMGCRLPQFWCKTRENRLTIGSRYISAEGDTILGAAYDEQVKQVFRELGKLTEDCRLK